MPLGVKVGPFIAMSKGSRGRSQDDPGVFKTLLLLVVAFVALVVIAVVVAWPFMLKINIVVESVIEGAWVALVVGLVWTSSAVTKRKEAAREAAKRWTGTWGDWKCEHSHTSQTEAQACAEAHGREVRANRAEAKATADLSGQLETLAKLHEAGTLSDEEYSTAKWRVLGGSPGPTL